MTVARAVWNQIQSNDYRLMKRVNHWRPPRWFRMFMVGATRLGDGWLWYACGVLLLFFGGPSRFEALGAGSVAALLAILLIRILKQISRRQRPCELEPHCWAVVLPPDQFSFPSGHSITAFALAVVLGSLYPHLLYGLFLVAASIAASREILGMHFLSDVLAGAALGTFLGLACLHVFRLL